MLVAFSVTPLGAGEDVGELVAEIPPPRSDHRQDEDPALFQQVLIDAGVVPADFVGRVSEIELDRSVAAGLEVYEQRPARRAEHVAGVRLAVE